MPLISLALIISSCAAPLNYTLLDGPRYTGCGSDSTVSWNPRTGQPVPPPAAGGEQHTPLQLRVVSFNIEFSVHVDHAIALLRSDPNLRDADILLLQEMDEPGVRRIGGKLGLCWVYYPATRHPQTGRDFGDAILSRYPIVEDHKVRLPHVGRFGHTQRIATAVTVNVGGTRARVYSVHLATFVELGPGKRADQARAIVADAAQFTGPVIVGGDLNSHTLGQVFSDAGYTWLTRDLGPTTGQESLDHFFLRGFGPAASALTGKVPESPAARAASDHVPIWLTVRFTPAGPRASS